LPALIEGIVEYNVKAIRECGAYGIDGVFLADDWGTQRSLMISPALWRKHFKPAYREMIDEAHRAGVQAHFHTDGYILEIVPDFIELGVDVLNPQQTLMDLTELQRLCKGSVCVRTDFDCQQILPYGTRAEIYAHVREVIATFKHPQGGVIAHGELQWDQPLENIRAMYEAVLEYGQY
jgi:uroporphyrinogen decarboxylase